MLKQISNFLKDEEGASAVEYGLILGLIAVAIIAIMITMGGGLTSLFNQASTGVTEAAGSSGTSQ